MVKPFQKQVNCRETHRLRQGRWQLSAGKIPRLRGLGMGKWVKS